MSKSQEHGSGFSGNQPHAAPKAPFPNGAGDQPEKEQLALALISQGRLDDAEHIYNELLRKGSSSYSILVNLGFILRSKGETKYAIEHYKQAIEIDPNHPDAHYNLGNAFQAQGELAHAITAYKKALHINPNQPSAHLSLGYIFMSQGDTDMAIKHYNTALELAPDYAEAHNNLGIAIQMNNELAPAINHYKTAIELKPDYPEAHNNLAAALMCQGDLRSAINAYEQALHLNPEYPDAQKNLSMVQLLAGDYKNGWKGYEARLKRKQGSHLIANPPITQWNGITASDKTQLLLIGEQGLGDTLQFMRYAITLKSLGFQTSLCAQTPLHSLIRASGIDTSPITPEQANRINKGQWIPLLSLPRHLGVSPENPILTRPYIKTTNELVAKWQALLACEKRPIIGINWQGNPDQETTNSIGRSFPLQTFAPIASGIDVTLLSLQKGFGSEQLETCVFKDHFVRCQDQVSDTWDFLETAAIIANCDLVITSDTCVAHLAGGMGKATWLLLKKVPEWRWGLEGDRTFWYPSIRLFRQSERGNWGEVMERVAEELTQSLGCDSAEMQRTETFPGVKEESSQGVLAPISPGDLIDKITILQIKSNSLHGNALKNAKKEHKVLEKVFESLEIRINPTLIQRLREVNQDIWEIKEAIRDHERKKDFGETFIRLSRSVYQQDDRRKDIINEINGNHDSTQAK